MDIRVKNEKKYFQQLINHSNIQKLERIRIDEEKLKLKKEKEKIVAKEPDADDPNATLIIFRYPDGNQRTERRFLKSDKIKVMIINIGFVRLC